MHERTSSYRAVRSVVWEGVGIRDPVCVSEAKGKYVGKCCIYMGLVMGW